jgi:hypothetical protein
MQADVIFVGTAGIASVSKSNSTLLEKAVAIFAAAFS